MSNEKTTQRTALYGFVLWLIAMAVIIVGYFLTEERFLDQDWLSRAGCLVVVLGIWSGVGGVIESKLLHRTITMRKRLAERRIRQAFSADSELQDKELQRIQQEHQDRLISLQNELGLSIGIIEASLLIIGTLLWGFGDLIKYV